MDDLISNLDSAISLARESAHIGNRIDEVEHPDSPLVKVPVILTTAGNEAGNLETSVRLADDILAELDKRMPGPKRRTNSVTLTEVGSLVEYMKRYQTADTVVYADTKALGFVVVFDEHPAGGTAWRESRARYTCPRSPEWLAWTQAEGKALKQDEFADFLEARLEDLTAGGGKYPKAVEVLAVARQLHIRTKGTFQREINPTTGDHVMINKTETEQGSTEIPRAFGIAVPVFESGERYEVEARVRFALVNGVPSFSFTLHRRAEIERDAFDAVRTVIEQATGRLMLAGTP